jgi:hypothetical protein
MTSLTKRRRKKRPHGMVKLHRPRPRDDHGWATKYLPRSLPFFQNERGMLAHRVKSIAEHYRDGVLSHRSVDYLCGNGTGVRAGGEFLAEPTRLLCAFCEFRAQQAKLPSADRLVGRHVHIGRLRVEQTCCQDKKDRN